MSSVVFNLVYNAVAKSLNRNLTTNEMLYINNFINNNLQYTYGYPDNIIADSISRKILYDYYGKYNKQNAQNQQPQGQFQSNFGNQFTNRQNPQMSNPQMLNPQMANSQMPIINNISKSTPHNEILNMHEIQKENLRMEFEEEEQKYIQIDKKIADVKYIKNPKADTEKILKHYLIFDSRYRSLEIDGNKIRWRYMYDPNPNTRYGM